MTEQDQTPDIADDEDVKGHNHYFATKGDDTEGHHHWIKDDDAEGHVHGSVKDDTKDDDTEGHNGKW